MYLHVCEQCPVHFKRTNVNRWRSGVAHRATLLTNTTCTWLSYRHRDAYLLWTLHNPQEFSWTNKTTMCSCEPVKDYWLERNLLTGPWRRTQIWVRCLEWYETTSFFHSIWLGLYNSYLETIFLLCKKNKKPVTVISHSKQADIKFLQALNNPHTVGIQAAINLSMWPQTTQG